MSSLLADVRPSTSNSGCVWQSYMMLFILAVGLRLGWVLYRGAAALEFPDERLYWSLAESIHNDNTYVDAEGAQVSYMPLYPAFLSLFVATGSPLQTARIAQAILAALAAPLTAGLARRVGSSTSAWIAGLLVAVDPFFVFFSQLLLTESLFVVVLLAMWYAGFRLTEPRSSRVPLLLALFAVSFTAAVYLRPSSAAILLLWVPFALFRCGDPSRPVLGLLCGSGLLILALMPWASRNDRVVGRPVWLTLRSGISLYDGLGPRATGASDLSGVNTLSAVAAMDEVRRNDYFTRQALVNACENPTRTFTLAWSKLVRTWSLFPHAAGYRSGFVIAVSALWMAFVYVLMGFGLFRLRDRLSTVCLLLVPAIYFSAVHMIFVGSVRYRLGAMPMIEVFAALGAAGLIDRFRKKPYGLPESSADGTSAIPHKRGMT